MKKRHPFRALLERLGWVRSHEETVERYAEADKVRAEAMREVEDARRRRALAQEVKSYRR